MVFHDAKPGEATAASEAPTPSGPLDLADLLPAGRIPVDVGPELIELIPSFLEAVRRDVAVAIEAAAREELETVRRLAHQLKGSAGAYGLTGLSRIARRLEQAVEAGEAEAVEQLARAMLTYLDRVEVVSRLSRSPVEDS